MLGLLVSVVTARGDQITMFASKPSEGSFKGVSNGSLVYQNEKGKMCKELPSRISRITFAEPVKVSYTTQDGKSDESALLKGYEKQSFQLEKDGKTLQLAATKIKSMDVVLETEAAGDGAVEEEGRPYPIPPFDAATLQAALPNPTEPQQKALARLEKAKQAFDTFLAENSALVAKLDKGVGTRMELLNTLRARKNKETPLRNELLTAYQALAKMCPPGALAAPNPDAVEARPEREKIKKAVAEW
jgi:hypothetical protein